MSANLLRTVPDTRIQLPVRASTRVTATLVEAVVHTPVKPPKVKDRAINCTPAAPKPAVRNLLRKEAVVASNLHGVRSERRIAKGMGARLTVSSGNQIHDKGDMRVQDFLVEAKSTVNASIPLTLAHLVKISEEAISKGKRPALTVSFVLPTGRPRPMAATDWVVIPLATFQELLEYSQDNN